MRPTALFRLYQVLSALALPFAARRAVARLRAAGVSVTRAHERLGHATAQRRAGPLIWFRGASVGEAKSTLALIARIAGDYPDAAILLTSGTATSAQAVAGRLPKRAVHQFSPLDGTGPVSRFLRHWRPDLCVLVSGESVDGQFELAGKEVFTVIRGNLYLVTLGLEHGFHQQDFFIQHQLKIAGAVTYEHQHGIFIAKRQAIQ